MPLVGRKLRGVYGNGVFTGNIRYFNTALKEYNVLYEDGTDDYFVEEDIDGVELILIWFNLEIPCCCIICYCLSHNFSSCTKNDLFSIYWFELRSVRCNSVLLYSALYFWVINLRSRVKIWFIFHFNILWNKNKIRTNWALILKKGILK